MAERILPVVDSVLANGPGANAGLVAGDRIIAIDGIAINSWSSLKAELDSLKKRECSTFSLLVQRDSIYEIRATVDSTYTLGILVKGNDYPIVQRDYGFFASFPAGIMFGLDVLYGYVNDFQYVFTSEGAQSVGMFASIGSLFPPTWNWHEFWLMTAFLSIILAFMNILPIPALDGGHMVFTLYEIITGRKPSDRFLYIMQIIGMILVFGLMFLAFGNDIGRLLR